MRAAFSESSRRQADVVRRAAAALSDGWAGPASLGVMRAWEAFVRESRKDADLVGLRELLHALQRRAVAVIERAFGGGLLGQERRLRPSRGALLLDQP